MNNYPKESIEQSGISNTIVCKEQGRIFSLINKFQYFTQKVRVDASLIKAGNKCDYAIDAAKKWKNRKNLSY